MRLIIIIDFYNIDGHFYGIYLEEEIIKDVYCVNKSIRVLD